MAKNKNEFTCGHCKEKFESSVDLPKVDKDTVLVCADCNNELMAIFGKGGVE